MCSCTMLRLFLLCQLIKPFKDCLISRFLRSQKYENVQKGVGDMMRGALIETEARTILNQGIKQGKKEMKEKTAIKMLNMGKLTIEEIAECAELSVAEVEQLAELQTV